MQFLNIADCSKVDVYFQQNRASRLNILVRPLLYALPLIGISKSDGDREMAEVRIQEFVSLLLSRRQSLLEEETSAQMAVVQELTEIRLALRRLQVGTYGICETCDQPIIAERLLRVPTIRCCAGCQQEFEENLSRRPPPP